MSARPSPPPDDSRRRFLQAGAVAGAGLLAGAAAPALRAAAAPPASARRAAPAPDDAGRRLGAGARPGVARNVLFFVSDGMSIGTLTLADRALRERRGSPSWWTRLWSMPGARRAAVGTESANSLVTDSAAGGSAWGVGRKVNNGAVNVLPDGSNRTPILMLAREAGMRTGLVTTTRITDATPASFAANVPKRSMEHAIAEQLLERGIDVLLGGGERFFREEALQEAKDIVLVRRAEEIPSAQARPGRLVGLFASGSLPFELDRQRLENGGDVPSLAQMTSAALERLAAAVGDDGPGFMIQVEGGRVDHAAHRNDAGTLLAEQMAFDDALGVGLRFAMERDDTLVIVTTDHANASPGLTLYGSSGNDGFRRALGASHSFEWIRKQLEREQESRPNAASAEALPRLVREATGIELAPDEVAWVCRRLIENERVSGFAAQDSPEAALGAVLANHTGIGFASTNHTQDLVEAAAFGPGAELLEPVVENTALHGLMVAALGLRV